MRLKVRLLAFAVATALLAMPIGTASSSAVGISGSTTSVGTAAGVRAAVAAATSIRKIPSDLTPSLQSFGNPATAFQEAGPSSYGKCDPYNSAVLAASPKPCLFGDLQSTKTIVLVGDSNVGNWAPALDLGLRKLGYRLAAFAFSGCPTSDVKYGAFIGPRYKECNSWHEDVPSRIRALHPLGSTPD